MFTYNATPEIDALVTGLETRRARLDAAATLPRRWHGRLRREIEAGAIAASTSMEGVDVTVDDVHRILAGDRPGSVSPEDAALVQGYREAMGYVLRRADDSDFAWHPELIRAIHDRVLASSYQRGAGRYRSKPVYIVSHRDGTVAFTPPDADRVPALTEAALADITSSALPVPVTAALLHVAIAAIHPFPDGNGRTSRIIASLAMYRGGFRRPEFTSLEEWWGGHRDDYYRAFRCLGAVWDPGADVTPFVRAHLAGQVDQVDQYEERLNAELDVWTALENIVIDRADPRTAEALYDAFSGRAISNRYYREVAGISSVTAASDLARLVATGLLTSRGAGVSTEYVASPYLMAVLAGELGLAGGPEEAPIGEQRRWLLAALRLRVRER